MSASNATIPKGSIVLVTGATGYIASQIIKDLLERGYKVRGTVRDTKKADFLNTELFPSYATSGAFELIQVTDIANPGAFDEAVKGVSGVIHLATIATWSPVPDEVIPPTVKAAVNAVEAAYKEPSVKRVVFTSSLVAQATPLADTNFHVDANTWNDGVASAAYAPPPYDPSRAIIVYAQAKVEAEKALWKFVEEKKPQFTLNTVHPGIVLGKVLNPRQWSVTPGWVKSLWNGDLEPIKDSDAFPFVHVRDVEAVHVAALLDPETTNARLPTWGEGMNWNDVLAIFRKVAPARKFVDDLPGMGKWLATVDEAQSEALLRKWAKQDKWISFETGITEMAHQLLEMSS